MSRPRLFAELPAGLASVSLRLHGGANCRPPISRMGNKAGYGEVILAALGLRSGQGAGRYLWAEADPDVAALLRCYPDADMLRRVAEIIRGWKDEEPRALWERLRAERKARAVRSADEEVAAWFPESDWAYRQGNPDSGFNPSVATGVAYNAGPATWANRCHRLAEYAAIVSGNRLVNMAGPALMNTGNGGTRHGGDFATPVGDVAAAFERVAREVAGFGVLGQWSFRRGEPESGFNPGLLTDREPTSTGGNGAKARTCEQEASLWKPAAGVPGWPAVLVLPLIPEAADVAAWMGTPGDLEDCVVYMDPPYVGTTGYAATLGRDEVVRHARAYAALGATVAISEAEVVIPEWCAVEITAGRKGQKRTFSKQQAEWVTMNREPAHRVATQPALFAVGA